MTTSTQIYADRKAARQLSAYLSSPAAKTSPSLASFLASHPDVSVAASIAALSPSSPSASLDRAIDRINARAGLDPQAIYARRREEAQARGRAAGFIR
jgi:hypothetical protein